MYIYERKMYSAIFMEETCLNIDAAQNTLPRESIHVTFTANDEKFVLLQLTSSVSFKTLRVYTTNLTENKKNLPKV